MRSDIYNILKIIVPVATVILAAVMLYRYFYLGIESGFLVVAVAILSIANLTIFQHRS